jgi:AcrR family transcriptional regulator
MEKTEVKRQLILNGIADHLLSHGMKASSLRQVAAAVNTSDRMLLHYFVDKEEMMTAALNLVSERMINRLASIHSEQMPFQTLLPYLVEMLKDPDIRPYLRLWLELAALSAGEDGSYRMIARQICDSFYVWIAAALQVEKEEERAPMAALAFATLEGFVLFDALNYSSKITSALKGIELR